MARIGAVQGAYLVRFAPPEYLGIEIYAPGLVTLPPPHPFTTGVGGTAEILPQRDGFAASQGFECLIDHVDFRFNTLDRTLIEDMPIRFVSLGFAWDECRFTFCVFVLAVLSTH